MDPFTPDDSHTAPGATPPAEPETVAPRKRRWRVRIFLLVLLLTIVGGGFAIGSLRDDDSPMEAPEVAGAVQPTTPPVGRGGRGGPVGGVEHMQALLKGVPQDQLTIGAGPITIIEFVDFQCPYCAQHEVTVQPSVVQELVRTDRVRVSMLPLAFLGPDSEKARTIYLKLSERKLGWQFADLLFRNQGTENTDYMTQAYLEKLLAEIPGTTPADADPTPNAFSTKWAGITEDLAKRGGVNGTPSFAVGRTGADLGTFQIVGSDFEAALRAVLELENGGPTAPTTPGTPTPGPGTPTPDPGTPPGGAPAPTTPDRDLPRNSITT